MPTLVTKEILVPRRDLDQSEGSETILYDRSMTLLGDDDSREEMEGGNRPQQQQPPRAATSPVIDRRALAEDSLAPNEADNDDPSVDESATVFSKTILCDDTMDDNHDDSLSQIEAEPQPQLDTQPPMRDETNWKVRTKSRPRATTWENPVGPNQTLYKSKYETFVKSTIRDFDRRHPGKLKDYRNLPPEEQAKERQRVLALLSRLKIGSLKDQSQQIHSQRHASSSSQRGNPASPPIDRERLLNDTLSPLMSPDCHRPPQLDDDESNSFCVHQQDDSEMTEVLPTNGLLGGSGEGSARAPSGMNDSRHSSESVELVRAAAMDGSSVSSHNHPPIYDSPDELDTTNPYKRQASTSAKRGADHYRKRYNEDIVPPPIDEASLSDNSQALSTRMERLSISPAAASPKDFFSASQSPISPKFTYGSSESDSDSVERTRPSSRGGPRDRSRHRPSIRQSIQASIDTIDTFTTMNKAKLRAMREKPVNVGLKEGAHFHIDKLHVKRSQMTRINKNGIGGVHRRLVNFPDPLTRYNTKQKKVLNDVFEALRQSEVDSEHQTTVETSSANVLFSLSYEQIIDLCLKLFLDDEIDGRQNQGFLDSTVSLQGHTVVVVRSKEDAATWEQALRESTGCSVFNHSTAPLSERVRTSTAKKVSNFDVTLTTFDALKATDVAIPVDDAGHAILSTPGEEKGWLASRTSSSQAETARPQPCKQLSVLHKVNFQRAIFVDLLGRKSFLAKHGTTRAAAAVALRANSRLVFFCASEADGDSAFRALTKSDKHATQSLSAILHLQTGTSNDDEDCTESDDEQASDPLESCALDLKALL